MDPLADVLELSGVRGALLGNVRAHAPWGIDLPQSTGASFHAVTAGTGWLRVPGEAPRQLMHGDLLLLPTGMTHALSSEIDQDCQPFDRTMKEELMTPEGDLFLAGPGARRPSSVRATTTTTTSLRMCGRSASSTPSRLRTVIWI